MRRTIGFAAKATVIWIRSHFKVARMSRRQLLYALAVLTLSAIVVALFYWRPAQHARMSGVSVGRTAASHSQSGTFLTGIAADTNGNIYVVAHKQDRILEVSAAHDVTIVAGSGSRGFGGDGGPANQASLDSPTSIALDPAGNLFIADTGNNRIRYVDAKTHIITTVAGNGISGAALGKSATSSALYQPRSVTVDTDGNLYIGTTDGIRRVDAISHVMTWVLGDGYQGISPALVHAGGPYLVAAGEHGILFFSAPNRNTVSLFPYPENDIHVMAGNSVCGFDGDGGPASGASLCFPEALSVRGGQELFIADTGNNAVRRVDLNTGVITTVAGNGQAGYVGDGGLAINARLNGPMAITVDRRGYLYIADTGNHCIRLLDRQTGIITTSVTDRDLQLTSRSEPSRAERNQASAAELK
jgi:streptogramin lyase